MPSTIAPMTATIFVVDDDADTVEAMTEILEDIGGYNVRVAKNGRFAIESIQKSPPDLILLDVKMDDINGEEIYQILQHNPGTCHVPIIFVTGFDKPANVFKNWDNLGMDFITKPFDINQLLRKIKNRLMG
ncbi:two-component system response regulator [[Phormidium] sp. ETS-05]|uniref:response regulator n=1 Tax=[Phormidium] sp. ETS-05 TaxID=222819 RepID=UPI0018EF14F2|nr:response regulator [[Phormidium] sp. ETS-05]